MSEADLVCESVEWVRRELRDLMGKQKKERPWLNCPTEREWAIAKLWDPEMSETEWAHVLKVLRPILAEPKRQRKRLSEVAGGAAANPSSKTRRKM